MNQEPLPGVITESLRPGEKAKRISGYVDYFATDRGRVLSLKGVGGVRVRDLARSENSSGYLHVRLSRDGKVTCFAVHDLIAKTFLGARPPDQEVAHTDGDKRNNCLDNLRYVSPKENAQDRESHGNTKRGNDNGNAKLTGDEVRAIRRAYSAGRTQQDIADEYGLSQPYVSVLVRGITWKHMQ